MIYRNKDGQWRSVGSKVNARHIPMLDQAYAAGRASILAEVREAQKGLLPFHELKAHRNAIEGGDEAKSKAGFRAIYTHNASIAKLRGLK